MTASAINTPHLHLSHISCPQAAAHPAAAFTFAFSSGLPIELPPGIARKGTALGLPSKLDADEADDGIAAPVLGASPANGLVVVGCADTEGGAGGCEDTDFGIGVGAVATSGLPRSASPMLGKSRRAGAQNWNKTQKRISFRCYENTTGLIPIPSLKTEFGREMQMTQ